MSQALGRAGEAQRHATIRVDVIRERQAFGASVSVDGRFVVSTSADSLVNLLARVGHLVSKLEATRFSGLGKAPPVDQGAMHRGIAAHFDAVGHYLRAVGFQRVPAGAPLVLGPSAMELPEIDELEESIARVTAHGGPDASDHLRLVLRGLLRRVRELERVR